MQDSHRQHDFNTLPKQILDDLNYDYGAPTLERALNSLNNYLVVSDEFRAS